MSSYNELIALINGCINRNGVQAITGRVLNGVLRAMVNQLGAGYTMGGVAHPTDDPGTPEAPVCYYASEVGTYTHFGNIQIVPGELALLCFDLTDGWFKETMYEGFESVQATIDGNVGTPAVNVSYVNGVLSFDFSNMKGNTGAAAGFGNVTAAVDGTIGTPGVTVQTDGPDTAKNIAFQFTGLKGETGVTSVIATVDNTSGTPQCAVSLNGQQLTLAFTGLKGAQGDTGVSADYPITIVNNLTTNDPTSALSAAQGVVLAGQVSQLELKVDGLNASLGLTDIGVDVDTFMSFTNGALSSMNGQNVSQPIPLIQGVTYNVFWNNDIGGWNTTKTAIWGYAADGVTPIANSEVYPTDSKHITYSSNNPDVKYFRIRIDTYQYTYPADFSLSYAIIGLKGRVENLESNVISLGNSINAIIGDVSRFKVYVAKTGADTNDGTKDSPFLTIGKALLSVTQNGSAIIVSAGDYKEAIDVASTPIEDVTIIPASPFDKVRIIGGEDYALTKDSGYNNIYYADFALRDSPNGEKIAYLDGIPSLPVSISDAFPQMHGKKYRLPFIEFTNRLTKDYETKTDALAFMDGQSEDCLWYDSDNERVYVHSLTDLTGKSLTIPNTPTCKKAPAGCTKSFHCFGIDFMYGYTSDAVNYHTGGFDSIHLRLAEFVKCSFMGNHSTGLASNAMFNHIIDCESGGNGNDGFGSQLYNPTYDIPERLDYTIIYDSCWGHDNYDDGFTDHTRGRDIVKNCLASYNYKGDGFHFIASSCAEFYNCIAYKNTRHGFVFAGQANDEGRSGLSILLMECIADGGEYGYEFSTTSYPAVVRMFNCKSMNSQIAGYRIYGTSSGERKMFLTDCRSFNDVSVKAISGDANATLNIINTNAVTE